MTGAIQINWLKPFKLSGVTCFLAQHQGEWLIASTNVPKFCFAAPTRPLAIAKAERGLTFWRSPKAKAAIAKAEGRAP